MGEKTFDLDEWRGGMNCRRSYSNLKRVNDGSMKHKGYKFMFFNVRSLSVGSTDFVGRLWYFHQ